ncbi:hypothetical protein PODOV061v2_0014 [Vibrio phage 172P1]|nr:hypothetical protein PODOV061v2_0014 [Vibrio phage 172P1]
MANNIGETLTSGGGIRPVVQPVQDNTTSAVLQGIGTGMSLFSSNLSNQKMQDAAAAEDLKARQAADASNAAAKYVSEVQQVKATKGGLAAQTFAAQKFAEIQGSLGVGTREEFVDHVKKGLGFNPIEASTNKLIEQEEAKQEKEIKDRNTATTIYLSSVDLNNPESVQMASANVESMSQDQINYILQVNAAEDLRIQKELQSHNLFQERTATQDMKRGKAQRLATTAMSAGFNKLTAGFQVRMEQAIASGDVNTIMNVQKEGLSRLQLLEAGLAEETSGIVQGMGFQDVDQTTLSAQLQPLRNQIANLKAMFKMTDLQNATQATTKYLFTTALNHTATQNTETGRVATAVLSDQLFGTRFGQTYIEKWATKDLLHNALMFNGIEQDSNKASVKKLEDATTQGSVFAVQELDPASPNLPELVADLTQAQVTALQVGVKNPENRTVLAGGVVQNWEAAAFGQSSNAIRGKVFEPTLNFFAEAGNAAAYKGELAGTEDVFLAASMEYVKGNVMPALTQAVGLSSQDLSTKFEVKVQDGKFKLTPKAVDGGSEFSPAGQAASAANSQRRVVTQAARKTEALYNKILLTYSNLYDVNLNTAMEVFAEKYAQGLGVDLIEVEDTENVE